MISLSQGSARNASQSAFPQLWNGLRFAVTPNDGCRGNVLVDYVSQRNGAFSSTPPLYVNDEKTVALKFSGTINTERVTTTYAETLGDFSASAWFRSTGAGYGNYDRIIDKGFDTGFCVCRQSSSANTWAAYVVDPTASAPVSVTLTDGLWHHIVVTRRGSSVTVYGDGGRVSTTVTRVSTALSTRTLAIGWSSVADGYNMFSGRIGEVLVYNRAITSDEVKSLYHGKSPLTPINDFSIWQAVASSFIPAPYFYHSAA